MLLWTLVWDIYIHTVSRLGPYAPDLPDVHTTEQWQADFSYNTILTLQNMAFYASYDEVSANNITNCPSVITLIILNDLRKSHKSQ